MASTMRKVSRPVLLEKRFSSRDAYLRRMDVEEMGEHVSGFTKINRMNEGMDKGAAR